MRPLTFKWFLASYVQYLAGVQTADVGRLVHALRSEPRLAEPLILWATLSGRDGRLARALGKQELLRAELQTLVELRDSGRLEEALGSKKSGLRPEYRKVWASYVARRDVPARNAQRKLEMREAVLKLEAQKKVTRYRMAVDLGLNHGNLHAFLNQGIPKKLSLEKANALVHYLQVA